MGDSKVFNFLVKHFLLYAIIMAIAIFYSSYLFFIKPAFTQIKSGGPLDRDSQKKIFLELKRYLKDLEKLENDLGKIKEEDYQKLDLVIPKEINIPKIYLELEELAKTHGFTLKRVETGEVKGGVINIYLEISGGNYEQFKDFLGALERNVRLMDVTSIKFSPKILVYSLNIKTYYSE